MRKNILILGHNYATQFVDIYNQYTRLFDKNTYQITVAFLTGKPDSAIKQRLLADNIIFFDFNKKTIRGLKIGAIRQLLALTREKKFHLVICHRYKPSYIMMWVAWLQKIPALIFVMHELKTMTAWGRKLLIKLLRRSNMWFAGVSNAVRDDMRRSLSGIISEERVMTLYNTIDIELTEPQFLSRHTAREQLGLAENSFVFGNLARLVPNKDQHTLIEAFALIKPVCPQAKLIIAGTGELETALKAQVAAHGLHEDIIFTGFLSNGFRFMPAFDCFVLPSKQEAFGRVLLEAMLAKTPVIAARVNGIPEVVGSVGTLIKAGDIAGLAQAMKDFYLLSATERAARAEQAYQHVLNHFSIPAFQQQFARLALLEE
jgi:glycosyltransferase involved in cell wall biosynthesis